MKEIIETIAEGDYRNNRPSHGVDQPDLVSDTDIGGMHTSILELRVAREDAQPKNEWRSK